MRKNIESLTNEEWNALKIVFDKMGSLKRSTTTKYQQISNYHGEPFKFCHFDNNGDVDESKFLGWHRAYMLQFENFMIEANGGPISLPYYDCASDYAFEMDSLHPKLTKTPFDSAWIGILNRRSRRDQSVEDLPLALCRKKLKSTFNKKFSRTLDFQEHLRKGIHNFLHIWGGADLADLAYASFDPLFWFHHANMDRLWVIWQQGEGSSIQRGELARNEEYLNWDFSTRGFNGFRYRDFMNNSDQPSLNGGRKRISIIYEDQVNLYTSSKRSLSYSSPLEHSTTSKLDTMQQQQNEISITLRNLYAFDDSFILNVQAKIGEELKYIGDFTILGYGENCGNGICLSPNKDSIHRREENFEYSIDIASDFWNEIKVNEHFTITIDVYNVSKKKKITFEEFKQQNEFEIYLEHGDKNQVKVDDKLPELIILSN